MTKIFFILNQHAILIQEVSQAIPDLLDKMRSGNWQDLQPIHQVILQQYSLENIHLFPLGNWGIIAMPQTVSDLPEPGATIQLSPRQRQVLDCLAQGMTSKQIAAQLHLSRRTINLHIAAIKNKLNTETNAQSVGRATALGYCRPRMRRREN